MAPTYNHIIQQYYCSCMPMRRKDAHQRPKTRAIESPRYQKCLFPLFGVECGVINIISDAICLLASLLAVQANLSHNVSDHSAIFQRPPVQHPLLQDYQDGNPPSPGAVEIGVASHVGSLRVDASLHLMLVRVFRKPTSCVGVRTCCCCSHSKNQQQQCRFRSSNSNSSSNSSRREGRCGPEAGVDD